MNPSSSVIPSNQPSVNPSVSISPSFTPSYNPSISAVPSFHPSYHPSVKPSVSISPSFMPSYNPSISAVPSHHPSYHPSVNPSVSFSPSSQPSYSPSISAVPSSLPSFISSATPSISQQPSLALSNNPSISTQPSDMPADNPTGVIYVIDVTLEGQIFFSGDSPNCESETFAIAVEDAISEVVIGGLQDNEELVSLTVSRDRSAECIFSFEAKIRIFETCTEGSSCNPNAIGESVAQNVTQTITDFAADTSANGLLAKVGDNGGDISGLSKAEATVDNDKVVDIKISSGVIIKVVIRTDDHPTQTSWTLVDTCYGKSSAFSGIVASGSGYTEKQNQEITFILARRSRYMFSILDTGGDGICCNTGQGYYKVFVDSIEEVSDNGQFGVNKIEHFGSCSAITTSKPTNMLTASLLNSPMNGES